MNNFSSDELIVGEDYHTIAEMYFRIKTDQIQHTRIVFNIMNWLGSIGGIKELLISFVCFIFGGFAEFNGFIQILNVLCVNQASDGQFENSRSSFASIKIPEEEDQIMNMSTKDRIKVYFMSQYKCLNSCCKLSNDSQLMAKHIDKGLNQYY